MPREIIGRTHGAVPWAFTSTISGGILRATSGRVLGEMAGDIFRKTWTGLPRGVPRRVFEKNIW